MKSFHNKSNYEIFNQKAEELLKLKLSGSGSPISETDVLKLIHELEVHQVELEIQNEELILAKKQAEVAASIYAQLYDLAPSGFFTLSSEGKTIELNLFGAQMLNKERKHLINSHFGFFVSDDTKPIFNKFLDNVFSNKSKETCEVTLLTSGNAPMYVLLSGIVIENGEKCLITMVDITGSRLMDALRANEEILISTEKRLQKEVELRTQELESVNKKIKTELTKRKISQKQLKQSVHDYKQLYAYLQNVREEERRVIARTIHDDLAQLLSSLKIELSSFKGNTDKLDFMVQDTIDTLLLLVEQCMNAVTSIITELRPIILDHLGLIPALKRLFSDFQKHTGISCDLLIREDSFNLGGDKATAIYRVIQEGLINIRMHSKASYVTVVIFSNPSIFSFTLKDNGIGISQGKISDPGSFGIIGMKERVQEIKGRISFKGTPFKGTTITVKVPMTYGPKD